MNKLAKILTIVLAVLMIVTFVGSVVRAEENQSLLTVNGTTNGRNLVVYKIFDLTVSGDRDNYDYSFNGIDSKIIDYFNSLKINGASNPITVEQATEYLHGMASDSQSLFDFATGLATYVGDGQTVASVTSNGYYLVYDKGNVNPRSAAMLVTVNGPTTIDLKADLVSISKTSNKTSANVGDTVDFTLTSKVPYTLGYTTYKFNIIDTLTDLTYVDNSLVVTIGENTLVASRDYTLTLEGNILTISINKSALTANNVNDAITVTYSATLNANATANNYATNTAKIEYSNIPGNTQSTEFTAEASVDVYTYSIVVSKKNSFGTTLANAKFVLKNGDKYASVTNGVVTWVEDQEDATTYVTGENGTVSVSGIAAGEYTLVEIAAPEGYGVPTNPNFTFEIAQGQTAVGAATLTNTMQKNANYLTVTDAEYAKGNNDCFAITILNAKTGMLPSTGSIGTTIFTVVGIAIMAIAATVVVVRNRKND